MITCPAARPSTGQGARVSNANTSSSALANPMRSARNVIGPAEGKPYLAPMNPVDHSTTKKAGTSFLDKVNARREGPTSRHGHPS